MLTILTSTIPTLIFLVVFSAINKGSTRNTIILYYAISLVVAKITQTNALKKFTQDIHEGVFSNYLILPQNYIFNAIGEDWANIVFDLISSIPMAIIIFLLFNITWTPTISSIVLGIIAIIIGYFILFMIANIISLLAFFISQISYIYRMGEFLTNVLAGIFFPIFLLPGMLRVVAQASPYAYGVYYPTQILNGQIVGNQAFYTLIIAILWFFALCLFYYFLYKKTIKYYTSSGG